MIMGNYLGARPLCVATMATERHTGGMFHVTVVPENFEPDAGRELDDGTETSGTER